MELTAITTRYWAPLYVHALSSIFQDINNDILLPFPSPTPEL